MTLIWGQGSMDTYLYSYAMLPFSWYKRKFEEEAGRLKSVFSGIYQKFCALFTICMYSSVTRLMRFIESYILYRFNNKNYTFSRNTIGVVLMAQTRIKKCVHIRYDIFTTTVYCTCSITITAKLQCQHM